MAEKKQSILVVDDEPDIVDSLYDTFSDKYDVHKATNAKDAIEILAKNHIDLVISDQRMPETTGVELFEKMEKDHPQIGKVLLTGYADINAVVDGVNKGSIDKYITKPWDEIELKMTIENARKLYNLQINNKKLIKELHQKLI